MTRTQKFLILLTAFLIAFPSYFLSYAHFASKLSSWQREQSVDVFAQTGSTKLQAMINSMSIAGLAFVISAVLLLLALKFSKKNEQK